MDPPPSPLAVSDRVGKLVGQRAPLRLKEISIRIRLQLFSRLRELALFSLLPWY